jgi:hypothetical protein
MKNISNPIPVALIAFSCLLLSCAAHNSGIRSSINQDKRTAGEAKFDPLSYPGDNDIITADVPAAIDTQDSTGNISLPPENAVNGKKAVLIFAVQLFASKSNAEARDFKLAKASLFLEEMRVDYQAPYYRVIVGRSEGLDDAGILLKKVKDQGFPEAWLVRLLQ